MKITIKRFDKTYDLPYQREGAAAFDLYCRESVNIEPGKIKPVAQNVAVQVPEGHVMLLFARSSTALKRGLMLSNGVGVVDPFYSGDDDENLAFMLNITDKSVTVEAGDRIVQGMIIKPETITWHEVDSMPKPGYGGYKHL